MKRVIGGKLLRDANDLFPKGLELKGDRLLLDFTLVVEHARRGRDRNHVRHRPSPEGSDGELHRVDRLEALGSAGRADEPDDFVVEERWIPIRQEMKPIERVLE